MEYFTRKALKDSRSKRGRRAWEQRWKDYQTHVRSINPSLDGDWRKLASSDLQGAVVGSATRADWNEVVIETDRVTLCFKGVSEASLPKGCGSDTWLCHELHCSEDSGVSLLVLLEKTEIRVVAESVDLEGGNARRLAA